MDLSGPANQTLYTQQASGYYVYTRWTTMLVGKKKKHPFTFWGNVVPLCRQGTAC